LGRAESRLKLKNYSQAIEDATTAENLCPGYSLPARVRAKAYSAQGNQRQFAEESAKANNTSTMPLFVAQDLTKTKSMAGAQKMIMDKMNSASSKMFEGGLKEVTTKSELNKHFGKGLGYLSQNNYVSAIDEFTAAIQSYKEPKEKALWKDKKFADVILSRVYDSRAYCRLMRKEYELAVEDLTQSITLYPRKQDTFINRGKAYQMLGKQKEANADFATARNLKPYGHPTH